MRARALRIDSTVCKGAFYRAGISFVNPNAHQ